MLAWINQTVEQAAAAATSDVAAKWGVIGLLVTQVGLVVLAFINRRDIRDAKDVAVSTNQSVNNVEEGEPKLIDKVRKQQRDVAFLKESHKWQRDLLVRIAATVGIKAPLPPPDPDEQGVPAP